jgi:hypothetical protein
MYTGTLGGNGNDILKRVFYTFDGNIIATGETKSTSGDVSIEYGSAGISDIVIAKFNNQNFTYIEGAYYPNIEIYPNPATDYFKIKTDCKIELVSVYNVMGRKIIISKNGGYYNLTNIPKGLYFVEIKTSNGTIVKKIKH